MTNLTQQLLRELISYEMYSATVNEALPPPLGIPQAPTVDTPPPPAVADAVAADVRPHSPAHVSSDEDELAVIR